MDSVSSDLPRRRKRKTDGRSVPKATAVRSEENSPKVQLLDTRVTSGDAGTRESQRMQALLSPCKISLSLFVAFRFLFFGLFALDTWKHLGRGYKYGFGDYNISHLPFWLEQAILAWFPYWGRMLLVPSATLMQVCWMVMTFLSLRAAIGHGKQIETWVLVALQGYTYFCSQLNLFQHEYLLFIILLIFTQMDTSTTFPSNESDDPFKRSGTFKVIKSWPLRVLLWQISIVYFWTGVVKVEPVWLEGKLLPRLVSPTARQVVTSLANFIAANSENSNPTSVATIESYIWSGLATFVCVFEFFLVILFIVLPLLSSKDKNNNKDNIILLDNGYNTHNQGDKMKWFLFISGVLLHSGMEASGLQIGRFSFFMALLYFVLLPSPLVDLLCWFFKFYRDRVKVIETGFPRLFFDEPVVLRGIAFIGFFLGGGALIWMYIPYSVEVKAPALLIIAAITFPSLFFTSPGKQEQGKEKEEERGQEKEKEKEQGVRSTGKLKGKERETKNEKENERGKKKEDGKKGKGGFVVSCLVFFLCCSTLLVFEASMPTYREFHKGMAHSYIGVGDYVKGIEHYEAFIDYYGKAKEATALAEMGLFLESRKKPGDVEKALQCYRDSLAADERNMYGLWGLLSHYERKGSKEDACKISARLVPVAKQTIEGRCGYLDPTTCENNKKFAKHVQNKVPKLQQEYGCYKRV